MYEQTFGLKQKPFSLWPDPRFLYTSRTHARALNLLEYGLAEQTGFIVLTGEVGTGKTILVRHLLELVQNEIVVGLIPPINPSSTELLEWILLAYGIDFKNQNQVQQHQILIDFIVDRYAAEGRRCVLIVDEAQNLGAQALEQLRVLTNINSDTEQLLQFILVGQPELRGLLLRPELRQFVQRIFFDYDLQPLDRQDTTGYIRHRLRVAGGDPNLFDEPACAAVHYFAKGIPRLINALCDLALVHAYADEQPGIGIDTVIEAAAARSLGGLSAFAALPDDLSREQVRAGILTGDGFGPAGRSSAGERLRDRLRARD